MVIITEVHLLNLDAVGGELLGLVQILAGTNFFFSPPITKQDAALGETKHPQYLYPLMAFFFGDNVPAETGYVTGYVTQHNRDGYG